MKKTYIAPETTCTCVEVESIVAVSTFSMRYDSSQEVQDNEDIGVKANRTENYDVWNDDWSK